MRSKSKTVKQSYWLRQVTAADASDGTLSEYAAEHGLEIKALYQWKTKLIKLGLYSQHQATSIESSPSFVAVRPRPPEPLQKECCTITLGNGNRIEFSGALDTKAIRTIITSVGLRR